jgi:hypothetical protein
LEDKDVRVRRNAGFGLGLIDRKREPVLPALIKGLSDADPQVRVLSAGCLGIFQENFETPPLPAVPALVKLLKDDDAKVRQAAADALRNIDPRAADAQNPPPSGPEWKASVKVVDEKGQPIQGAQVTIGYYVKGSPGQDTRVDAKYGKTDIDGLFTASEHSTTTHLFFGAGKEGYCWVYRDYELGLPTQYDPLKWSPNVTLLLQPIARPIPRHDERR